MRKAGFLHKVLCYVFLGFKGNAMGAKCICLALISIMEKYIHLLLVKTKGGLIGF